MYMVVKIYYTIIRNNKMLLKLSWPLLLSLLVVSCVKPTTEQVALNSGFKQVFIQTSPFNLATYQKVLQTGTAVNIYIEGDGRAWVHNRLSNDPTPRTPLVMQLASLDPNPKVVYLSRPCQNSPQDLATVCDSKYWSLARYSETVVNSMNQAISKIKIATKATKLRLIGYSGGATIAALVAARRNDVENIRTIAGNLDLIAMQEYHNTTPLDESLDPIAVAKTIAKIPQLHFVGAKDHVVPSIVAKNFCQAAGLSQKIVIILKGVSHDSGWQEQWPELLKDIP
jgi:hypothetical protein